MPKEKEEQKEEELTLESIDKRLRALERQVCFLDRISAVHCHFAADQKKAMTIFTEDLFEAMRGYLPEDVIDKIERSVEIEEMARKAAQELSKKFAESKAKKGVILTNGNSACGMFENVGDALSALKSLLSGQGMQGGGPARQDKKQENVVKPESTFDIKCDRCGKVTDWLSTDGGHCDICGDNICEECADWAQEGEGDKTVIMCRDCYNKRHGNS
jgi:hypothetical protein